MSEELVDSIAIKPGVKERLLKALNEIKPNEALSLSELASRAGTTWVAARHHMNEIEQERAMPAGTSYISKPSGSRINRLYLKTT